MPSSSRTLTMDGLVALARGFAARPELWSDHVRAEPDRRHFHRLLDEPHATVWLICWMDGHDTGFHDHDGASGAVAVARGKIREERLRLGAAPVAAEFGPREVLSFGPDDIHRVLHAEGAPAVTIHAYSPQLLRMNQYLEGPAGTLLRRQVDEEVELKHADALMVPA